MNSIYEHKKKKHSPSKLLIKIKGTTKRLREKRILMKNINAIQEKRIEYFVSWIENIEPIIKTIDTESNLYMLATIACAYM